MDFLNIVWKDTLIWKQFEYVGIRKQNKLWLLTNSFHLFESFGPLEETKEGAVYALYWKQYNVKDYPGWLLCEDHCPPRSEIDVAFHQLDTNFQQLYACETETTIAAQRLHWYPASLRLLRFVCEAIAKAPGPKSLTSDIRELCPFLVEKGLVQRETFPFPNVYCVDAFQAAKYYLEERGDWKKIEPFRMAKQKEVLKLLRPRQWLEYDVVWNWSGHTNGFWYFMFDEPYVLLRNDDVIFLQHCLNHKRLTLMRRIGKLKFWRAEIVPVCTLENGDVKLVPRYPMDSLQRALAKIQQAPRATWMVQGDVRSILRHYQTAAHTKLYSKEDLERIKYQQEEEQEQEVKVEKLSIETFQQYYRNISLKPVSEACSRVDECLGWTDEENDELKISTPSTENEVIWSPNVSCSFLFEGTLWIATSKDLLLESLGNNQFAKYRLSTRGLLLKTLVACRSKPTRAHIIQFLSKCSDLLSANWKQKHVFSIASITWLNELKRSKQTRRLFLHLYETLVAECPERNVQSWLLKQSRVSQIFKWHSLENITAVVNWMKSVGWTNLPFVTYSVPKIVQELKDGEVLCCERTLLPELDALVDRMFWFQANGVVYLFGYALERSTYHLFRLEQERLVGFDLSIDHENDWYVFEALASVVHDGLETEESKLTYDFLNSLIVLLPNSEFFDTHSLEDSYLHCPDFF